MAKTIVLGVTGGIAAYKMPNAASAWTKAGYDVHVMMTEKARAFITPLAFEAVTHHDVILSDEQHAYGIYNQHIRLGSDADLMVIAPATANTIAKLAHGIADNIVTEAALVARCPVVVAPAMNTKMLGHPATQDNLRILRERGVLILEPESGILACGDIGAGRLPETSVFEDIAERLLAEPHDLTGKRIVINAGPTREGIDPVRFLTNHSTGKMGYALARAARNRGAETVLVTGPVSLQPPEGLTQVIPVTTAEEMYEAVLREAETADAVILSAAVADYRPAHPTDRKLKKGDGGLTLELERTRDILATLGARKRPGQVLCGFAMETEHLVENAKDKLHRKGADLIVANSLRTEGAGFGTETNVATLVTADGAEPLDKMSKYALANEILSRLWKKTR